MSKSCLDFVNSIGYNYFKDSVCDHFDQMMAFYRLCGTCDFESISSVTNDQMVDFNIYFANNQDATTLHYILSSASDRTIQVFGTSFGYDSEQIDETTLRVKIFPSAY